MKDASGTSCHNAPTCIYIAGYGRSGSTLLDVLISNVPGHQSVGEASNIFDALLSRQTCSCGRGIDQCPHWAWVIEWISRDPSLLSTLAKQQRRAEGFPWGLSLRGRTEYLNFWTEFFMRSHELGFAVVDSSKTARSSIFRPRNLKQIGVNVRMVHIVRESASLLETLVKGGNMYQVRRQAGAAPKYINEFIDLKIARLLGRERPVVHHAFLIRCFIGAMFANIATVLAAKVYGMERVVIRFSEIQNDPAAVLERLGLSGRSIDLQALEPGHGIAGNRLRRSGSKIEFSKGNPHSERVAAPLPYRVLYRALDIFL